MPLLDPAEPVLRERRDGGGVAELARDAGAADEGREGGGGGGAAATGSGLAYELACAVDRYRERLTPLTTHLLSSGSKTIELSSPSLATIGPDPSPSFFPNQPLSHPDLGSSIQSATFTPRSKGLTLPSSRFRSSFRGRLFLFSCRFIISLRRFRCSSPR
jgi:hypothetical protein